MELFGGAKIVATAKLRRRDPRRGVWVSENFETSALFSHLSAFQRLNLKYYRFEHF